MKRRIYTDTSVIGGCLDVEFRQPSLELLGLFKSGKAVIVLSDLTCLELEAAPAAVRQVLSAVAEANREYVELTEEASELANRYIEEQVLSRSKRVDAQHIAIATLARVDVLVSWNFRHIVNLDRIRGYNSVNMRYGYPLIEIRTPREVISHGSYE
jgi:hypothetical protein